MSWQTYVDTQMMEKKLKQAAIAGLDGSIWAKVTFMIHTYVFFLYSVSTLLVLRVGNKFGSKSTIYSLTLALMHIIAFMT